MFLTPQTFSQVPQPLQLSLTKKAYPLYEFHIFLIKKRSPKLKLKTSNNEALHNGFYALFKSVSIINKFINILMEITAKLL